MIAEPLAVLTIFVPIVGAGAVAASGRASARVRSGIAIGVAITTAALSLLTLTVLRDHPTRIGIWIPAMGVPFDLRVDALGGFVAAIAGSVGALVVVYSRAYMREAAREGYSMARYDALVLLFIGAMVGLALADSLLAFYIFWELIGLCSFALIAFYHRDPNARRAGLKAFAVTRIGDIGLLVAVVALWSQGIVTFSGLEAAGLPADVRSLAALGVLMAAVGKSAQVPLHVWLPDAMEAPTPVSALIHAATLVNAGVYLLARTAPAFGDLGWWSASLLWIGAASAVLAAVAALAETDLKRVLAYSTISQLGFMVAAVGAGAILASQFHLLSQAIFKALLFLAAGAAIQAAGTRDVFRMGGLRRGMPITSAAFLVGIAAMVGLPFANGFWSKDLLLGAVIEGGHLGAFLLLIVATVLTVGYGWRTFDLVFRGTTRTPDARDPDPSMAVVLVVLAAAALTSGFLIGPYSDALARTMPLRGIEPLPLWDAFLVTLRWPTAIVSLAVIAPSAALAARPGWSRSVRPRDGSVLAGAVGSGFGFDAAYVAFARRIGAAARAVRRTQTGDLNLNAIGLVAAVVVLLAAILLEGLG